MSQQLKLTQKCYALEQSGPLQFTLKAQSSASHVDSAGISVAPVTLILWQLNVLTPTNKADVLKYLHGLVDLTGDPELTTQVEELVTKAFNAMPEKVAI